MSVKSKQPDGFTTPKGIKKKEPTEGSKTQKRKANKANHIRNNTAGMR